ncbi:MAG TPA: phosphatase PAP2 family protein [Acidimicrobiales bacterium]|nr:phosphatase PAP2 family protein [Acidimicrobiales bacterium]
MENHEVPTPRQLAAPIRRFDTTIERVFDAIRGKPLVDRVFYTASELGNHSLIWHLLATAQGVRRDGDLAGTVRLVTIMGLESAIVNGPVKSMFRRQRPVHDGPRPFQLRQPRTSSFPSGHASAAAVFAVVAGEDDPLAPVYTVLATLVGASRVHVRIHHPSDVVGGAAVGVALGIALRTWWPAGQVLPRGLRRRG